MNRVTLDSNVYLSGFVFGGKPKRVLEMAIDGEIEVAVSDPIIQEVRRHLLGKFGWSEPRAAEAVESIAEFATRPARTSLAGIAAAIVRSGSRARSAAHCRSDSVSAQPLESDGH